MIGDRSSFVEVHKFSTLSPEFLKTSLSERDVPRLHLRLDVLTGLRLALVLLALLGLLEGLDLGFVLVERRLHILGMGHLRVGRERKDNCFFQTVVKGFFQSAISRYCERTRS